MARYNGPVCRQCRRAGQKLHLKGSRCVGPKCGIETHNSPPGMKGGSLPQRRPSDYALQLREKQQLKQIYGMLEKPFRRYVRRAERMSGVAGEMLLQLLEQRLDNVVYRAGFSMSRPQARQWVRHRHFSVNGKTVDVPSYQVRPGDVIQVREEFRASGHLLAAKDAGAAGGSLSWIRVAPEQFQVEIVSNPPRQEIDAPIDETVVMEFYSR
jgi:small subunit ribosomal protein S4